MNKSPTKIESGMELSIDEILKVNLQLAKSHRRGY